MALIVFGGSGFAILIAGLIWGARRYDLIRSGLRTTGKVVEHYKSVSRSAEDERNGIPATESYFPVVAFEPAEGQVVRFRGSTGGGIPDYEVGSTVEVVYDPRDPQKAQIVDFTQFWLGPVVVTVIGAVFFLMGIGAFFLIGDSDRAMEQTQKDMQQQFLVMRPDAIKIEARIREVRRTEGGQYVLVCWGTKPGGSWDETFESATFDFDPGQGLEGRSLTVYLDPSDLGNYHVETEPLLREIFQKRSP